MSSIATFSYAETMWEKYLMFPTPENASKVSEIEYSPGTIPTNYGYWAPDLKILQNQVLGGDKESFHLVFRLSEDADGGLLEDLTAILGRSVRAQPEQFLREMAILKPNDERLRAILMMPGLEYVDRPEARKYEIKMRRKALASIVDDSLRSYKEKCLRLMVK